MKQLIKKIIKQHFSKVGLFGIILLLASCVAEPNYEIFTYPAQTPSGMSPNSGFPGVDVTIKGKNFGSYTGAVKVYFGGILADTIRSCTDNLIVVKVPAKAISGKVSLSIWTTKNDSIGSFTVIPPPVIESVSKDSATPGDVITITGTGFGTDVSQLGISFNGTPATINSLTGGKSITVTAPAGFHSGPILLTLSGYPVKGPSVVYLVAVPNPVYQLDFENSLATTIGSAGATYIQGKAQPLSYIPGISGKAVSMAGYSVTDKGVHQAISLPTNSAQYNEMTVSCWVYHPGTVIPGNTWWEPVWSFGPSVWTLANPMFLDLFAARNSASTSSDKNLTSRFRTENKSGFNKPPYYNYVDVYSNTTQVIPTTGWHHLVMTVSKTNLQAITYLDGAPIGTLTLPSTFDLTLCTQANVFIGSNTDGNNNLCFAGGVDKFQIFNSVLSADQVYTLYYKK